MNRNRFLQLFAAFTAVPLSGFRKIDKKMFRRSKGFVAKKGEGRLHGHIRLKGVNENILDVKISGKDTDGGLAIFEQTSLSPKRGTPLHIHPAQDEVFYVLEGAYRFQVGSEQYDIAAGDTIFLPRNIPHAWVQLSQQGKMNVMLQPAGKLEEFFVTLAALKTPPTQTELAAIFAAHEMQVVGPPISVQ